MLWPESWHLACHAEHPRCGSSLCYIAIPACMGCRTSRPSSVTCVYKLPCWHLQLVTTNISYAGTPVIETYVLNQCNTAQPVSSQGPPGAKQFQTPLTAVDIAIPFVQAYLVRMQQCGRAPAQSARLSARQPLNPWA